MKLKITVKQLEEMQACDEGVKAFGDLFGKSANIEWTLEKQIEILKSRLGRYVGWAFCKHLIPMWSMSSANLSSADLRSADLCSANLSYANLSYANLRSANLSSADLRSADDLTGAFIDIDPKIAGYKFENGRLWRI